LSADGLSVTGKIQKIYEGWQYPKDWVTECFCLEGPKVMKKGDYFYITVAEGGTAGPATSHMVVSARSKNLFGPYENSPYNPVVHTYSADDQWWSKGHGMPIDDVNGNWWVVYHGYEKDFHTLGRQTLIEPVEWTEDGWFRLSKNVRPIKPGGPKINNGMELSDEFKGKTFGLQWTQWKSYEPEKFALKNNSLYISGKGSNPADARLFMVDANNESYELQVKITLEKWNIGGLILFYRETAYAGVYSDGTQFTVCENAEKQVKKPNELGSHFFIKIINNRNMCDILVSKDKQKWDTINSQLDVSGLHHNKYGDFLALQPCLMAAGTGSVKFNGFVYKPAKDFSSKK
jgi:beta-xylosidase